MIKTLRLKFIRITMAAVFVVLLMIILAVNTVNIRQNNKSLDSITQIIFENDGSFRKIQDNSDKFKPGNASGYPGFDERFHNKKELPFSTRFFAITTDENGNVIRSDLSSIASVTEEDIADFADKILEKKKKVGWIGTYRYRVGETDEGSLLIVMEATTVKSSILSVLLITILVGGVAFLSIFILVALFSKRAIQPISETYEKQKQFITDASHELKTPLTVISANTEILSLTYGKNEWCDGIERQTSSMRDLIANMIQMSKLDESAQKMDFERFNLSDAVYDTAMTFSALAKKNNLHMNFLIAPKLYINGDEGAIRQAVAILTDNALKYCDQDGEVLVGVHLEKNHGKERICVVIQNTYASVDALDTERIFERFYRSDKSRVADHSYGLGLPIARAIVEKHSGKLQAVKKNHKLELRIEFKTDYYSKRAAKN